MAATQFNCYECQTSFNEYLDIKRHISAKHLKYFPYKCMTCMEIGVRYETVSAELMYQHTSTVHLGIEPHVRFSSTEENELKIATEKCRRSIAAEQVLENDSKDGVRRVFISLGTALADSGTNDTGNETVNAELMYDQTSTLHLGTGPDVRPLMIREDELNTAIDNNRNSIGDTLADNGKSATESEVISTEIKQECDNLEVHGNRNNNSIGPTNEGLIYGIQPENVTTHADKANFNVSLQGLINSIKAESDSSRCDEPNLNVNGQENTETIDSQIPLVSSTEPTAVVETQENVTNPTTNSENTSALNTKSESPVNVSTVPIGLRLEAALSSYVPIDVDANEAQRNPAITTGRRPRILLRIPRLSPERKYPKRRRSTMEAINNDEDDEPTTSVETKRRGRKRRGEANSESNLQTKQLKRARNPNRYAENVAECSAHQKLLEKYRLLQKKPAAEPSTVGNRSMENVAECPRHAEVMARHRSLQKNPTAEPSTVTNSLPAQRSSEVNQCTAHNSNGDANENGESNSESNLQTKQLKHARNPNRYAENVAECPEYQGSNGGQLAGPIVDPSSISGQCTFETNQSSANNSNTVEKDKSQTTATENDRFQSPTTSAQAPLDVPCAQTMNVSKMWINISSGKANFETTAKKYQNRPLRFSKNLAECPEYQKLLPMYKSLEKKLAAGFLSFANSLPAQRLSEVNQRTAHNSNGDTNENGLLQNPQVALDARIDPAQKMKITHIRINIINGETCFRSTSSKPYHYVWHPPRPLSEYVSILRESEPDEPVCEAHIFYPFDNQKDRCPESARKKMEKLSQEILSIAHLWANGRVVAELFRYSEYANKILPISDFCDIFFSQDRSILKCKELGVSLDSWPMSVVTNAAHHCSKLILKETGYYGYCDKRLHFELLDALYNGKLPQEIVVIFERLFTRNQFIDELKKRFQHSKELNFKLSLFTPFVSFTPYYRTLYCAPPDVLLRNEHGLTLTAKKLSQYSKQRECVTIEQRTDS